MVGWPVPNRLTWKWLKTYNLSNENAHGHRRTKTYSCESLYDTENNTISTHQTALINFIAHYYFILIGLKAEGDRRRVMVVHILSLKQCYRGSRAQTRTVGVTQTIKTFLLLLLVQSVQSRVSDNDGKWRRETTTIIIIVKIIIIITVIKMTSAYNTRPTVIRYRTMCCGG